RKDRTLAAAAGEWRAGIRRSPSSRNRRVTAMFGRIAPTVQAKVILLVGAVALLGAACAGLFIVQTRANLTAQVFRDQDALADMYALAVEQYLAASRSVLESLAQQPPMRAPIRSDLIVEDLHGVPANAEVDRRAAIS